MLNSTNKKPTVLKFAVTATFAAALACAPFALAQEHEHGKQDLTAAPEKTATAEIVDLRCYLNHAAMAENHAGSGTNAIKAAGPVGMLKNGKAQSVAGEHK